MLARYQAALDDGDALAAAHAAARPPTALAHPARITRDELAALLPGSAPSRACPWALRWPTERPGHHWAHAAGLFHVMEEASLLPVALLDVRPGHRVLDACAAPGGKAARLAFALEGRGLLVANDRRAARHRATSSLFRRLGLAAAVTTVGDATRLDGIGTFDRVLVDAPCTAETQRAVPCAAVDAAFRETIARVQRALLDRAVALCRPGGRVVYSTCTYAPEENEAVVDHALRRGGVKVAAVHAAELSTSPGLVAFEGQAFHPSVAEAHRLWPHRSGTGGFFAAALDKEGRAAGEREREPAPDIDHTAWTTLRERFGLPPLDALGLRLHARGASLRLLPRQATLPSGVEIASAGLVLVRRRDRSAKLTTEAAMRLGRQATRNLVHLSAEERHRYLARLPVVLSPAQRQDAAGGYVIVRDGPHALGMGMLRGETLTSEFPKAWALQGPAARARASSPRKKG